MCAEHFKIDKHDREYTHDGEYTEESDEIDNYPRCRRVNCFNAPARNKKTCAYHLKEGRRKRQTAKGKIDNLQRQAEYSTPDPELNDSNAENSDNESTHSMEEMPEQCETIDASENMDVDMTAGIRLPPISTLFDIADSSQARLETTAKEALEAANIILSLREHW